MLDGWRDVIDPYVKLQLGEQKHQTKVIIDAGGNAIFNETFSFQDKSRTPQTLLFSTSLALIFT
jgi:hypothetical protein